MDYSHIQGAPLVAGIIVVLAMALLGVFTVAFGGSVQIG